MAKRSRKRKSAKQKPAVVEQVTAAEAASEEALQAQAEESAAAAPETADGKVEAASIAAEAVDAEATARADEVAESVEPAVAEARQEGAAIDADAVAAKAAEGQDTAAVEGAAVAAEADPTAASDESSEAVAPAPASPAYAPDSPEGKLMAKLQLLRERGAANFDWVGLDHAERLIQRGHALGGDAGKHLLRRADSYLADYAGRFKETRRKTRMEADRLARLGLVPLRETHKRLERGDWQRLRQLARKHPEQELRLRDRLSEQWSAALGAEAEKRGLTSPGTIETPSDEELERTRTMGLALALYRDAAASAHAALAIAKAVDSLPIEAGRYHATTVATRALQAMQDVPSYLRAQLNRLELLSLMETFGAPAISAQETAEMGDDKKTAKRTTKRSGRAPARRTTRKPRAEQTEPKADKAAVAS